MGSGFTQRNASRQLALLVPVLILRSDPPGDAGLTSPAAPERQERRRRNDQCAEASNVRKRRDSAPFWDQCADAGTTSPQTPE